MREEKQYINREYIERLNGSPFFILVDYQGLTVGHFAELRTRLRKAGSEIHVVKNSIFKIAAKESGITELGEGLNGQLAAVTGQHDISGAAKVIKNFHAEFEKPRFKFGFLNSQRLEQGDLAALADLPSLDVVRGMLMGVINAPATRLVRVIQEPAAQLARVLKAKSEKE